jgi:hypothetical protein
MEPANSAGPRRVIRAGTGDGLRQSPDISDFPKYGLD